MGRRVGVALILLLLAAGLVGRRDARSSRTEVCSLCGVLRVSRSVFSIPTSVELHPNACSRWVGEIDPDHGEHLWRLRSHARLGWAGASMACGRPPDPRFLWDARQELGPDPRLIELYATYRERVVAELSDAHFVRDLDRRAAALGD